MAIPPEDLITFQNSVAAYTDAFKEVLKQKKWKAGIDAPEAQQEDSIQIDTRTVEAALQQFQKFFIRKDFILLNGKEFDLKNPTLFELLVILEQIKWHRYEIEAEYITIVMTRRRQWTDVLCRKIKP